MNTWDVKFRASVLLRVFFLAGRLCQSCRLQKAWPKTEPSKPRATEHPLNDSIEKIISRTPNSGKRHRQTGKKKWEVHGRATSYDNNVLGPVLMPVGPVLMPPLRGLLACWLTLLQPTYESHSQPSTVLGSCSSMLADLPCTGNVPLVPCCNLP